MVTFFACPNSCTFSSAHPSRGAFSAPTWQPIRRGGCAAFKHRIRLAIYEHSRRTFIFGWRPLSLNLLSREKLSRLLSNLCPYYAMMSLVNGLYCYRVEASFGKGLGCVLYVEHTPEPSLGSHVESPEPISNVPLGQTSTYTHIRKGWMDLGGSASLDHA